MGRVHRQAGIQFIETLLKQASDASHPADSVFEEGLLANLVNEVESTGLNTSQAQDTYIQQLRSVYDKYLSPFHGRDTAAEKPPKVVSVPSDA